VEIDLFSDEMVIENNDLVQSGLTPSQLYPVIEGSEFKLRVEDFGKNDSCISNFESMKNFFISGNSNAFNDSSVINQLNSVLNAKQNESIGNLEFVNKENKVNDFNSLNLSKFTNFVDMSYQNSKKSLLYNKNPTNKNVKK
jgi:hypothetical protein